MESRITESDARLAGAPFRAFQFDAVAGRRYRVAMRSAEFPAYLRIGRNVGGITDYIRIGGNHGLDAGAALLLEAEETGSYLVVAHGASGETGAFSLTVDETSADVARRLYLGNAELGALAGESLHPFEGTAGEEVVITVRSSEFDTVLEVGRDVGGRFLALESNDDGAGGTDSRVYFTPDASGEYIARVREYSDGAGGGYAILLSTPPDLPDPTELTPGTPADGEITDANPTNDEGIPFADWSFEAVEGARYRIELRSAAFDTYLVVGQLAGSRFDEIESNDDAGGSGLGPTDSRLIFRADTGGERIIRVRPFGLEERGPYTLEVTQLPPAPSTAAGGSITTGTSIEGELTDADAILVSGEMHQEWRFTAQSGERFDIALSSGDFDTNLVVGRGSGREMTPLGRNDDGYDQPSATDSRLLFTAPTAGDYTIRVTSFGPGATGRYRLSLAAGPPPPPAVDRQLDIDAPRSDVLAINDYRLDDGAPFHDWRFDASAGETYVVDLASPDFDAYLEVGRVVDGAFRELGSNDDFGGGTDSRVEFTAIAGGEHVIRARPLFADGFGAYTVTIRRAR